MKIEILNGLGQAIVLDATRVLVTADDGTPAMVASEVIRHGGGVAINCAHLLDHDFQAVLSALGVDRTVVVDRVRTRPWDEIGKSGYR